jgi:hypothetical protein
VTYLYNYQQMGYDPADLDTLPYEEIFRHTDADGYTVVIEKDTRGDVQPNGLRAYRTTALKGNHKPLHDYFFLAANPGAEVAGSTRERVLAAFEATVRGVGNDLRNHLKATLKLGQ